MSVSPVCPRCGEELVVRPGSAAQAWCHVHGAVTPLHHAVLLAHDAIAAVTADARVPAWVPDPMPPGWAVTGMAWGGEPGRAGHRRRLRRPGAAGRLGRAAADRGGARHRRRLRVRRDCPDPTPATSSPGQNSVDVKAAGQRAPLWAVPTSDDRAAFVGEAYGVWLWLVMWPMNAAWLLAEQLELLDLRDRIYPDLPLGPRERAPAARQLNRYPTVSSLVGASRLRRMGPVLPMGRTGPPDSGRSDRAHRR